VFCFNLLGIPENLKPIYNSKKTFSYPFFLGSIHKNQNGKNSRKNYRHTCACEAFLLLLPSSYLAFTKISITQKQL
jgi:hypothetical protein